MLVQQQLGDLTLQLPWQLIVPPANSIQLFLSSSGFPFSEPAPKMTRIKIGVKRIKRGVSSLAVT